MEDPQKMPHRLSNHKKKMSSSTATAPPPNPRAGSATTYASTFFDGIRSLFIRSATNSPQQQQRKRHRDDENNSTAAAAAAAASDVHDSQQKRRRTAALSVTDYLRTMPSVMERVRQLQSRAPVVLSSQTDARIINVLQGEMAHATSDQADILVSDHATTCHVLAARSTSSDGATGGSNILASLCHIDQPGYERCIRDMIRLHKLHHHCSNENGENEEKKEGIPAANPRRVAIELHLVGGFNDSKRSSLSITEHIMKLFGRLTREEKGTVSFVIQTCAVSCLNDDGSCGPVGRGLAIDIKSGDTYLAKADASVAGPAVALRNSRLWAGACANRLTVIHTPFSDRIVVDPFDFAWDADCDWLNSLSDKEMLRETSTSPEVEEADYCDQIRSALRYMRENDAEEVFGHCCLTPAQYVRSKKDTHNWCSV